MAKVKIQGNASGTGILTVTAPNTSTDRTITLPDATGTLLTTADSVGGANGVDFNDNVKAKFGTGDDLQIYHDGTDSYISDAGAGNIKVITNGNGIYMQSSGGENLARFVNNGDCALYYDNSNKLTTTSTGIDVTGSATADTSLKVGTIGVVGNTANDVNIYSTGSGHNGLRMHVNGILPTDNTGTIVDADADLGDPSYRFKDLYLEGGAYIGGNGSANKLGDYETGTWTPTSSAFGSITVHSCIYTKIGRQVTLQAYIVGNTPNSNGITLAGLPFACPTNGWSVGSLNYATANTNHTNPHVRVRENTSDIQLKKDEDSTMIGTECSGHIIFTVAYFV